MDLTDRVGLVTGSTTGIGEATARAFASAGYTYWWLMRRMKRIWVDPARFDYTDTAIAPPAEDETEALEDLRRVQQVDFEEILEAMDGLP